MQRITLIAVGRLKEDYLTEASKEYSKRLSAFCRLNIIEIPPCRTDDSSPSGRAAAIEDEADRIAAKLPPRSLVIPMCIEGKQLASEELAELISDSALKGLSDICFIIGGSYGLSDRIKRTADLRLSMSKMTFPHQLARIMLLEQIYRAYTIISGSGYHK